MSRKNRQSNAGFTLIELCIVLAIASIFFVVTRPLYKLTTAAHFNAQVHTIAALCHAQHLTATLLGQQTSIIFDTRTSTYTTNKYGSYRLPPSLQFTHTTLPHKDGSIQALWNTDGVTQPGTLTIESLDGQKASLTLQRAHHAPVLVYWQRQNAWQRGR